MYSFTIFTATYNRANTIARVYESLCRQTYRNFEWILIDDASTDNTNEIINGFIQKADFKIIHYRQAQNKGKHIAYNKALELADSDFFTVVDSDDEIDADALEVFIAEWDKLLRDYRGGLSGLYFRCKKPNGIFYKKPLHENVILTDDIEMEYKLKLQGDQWWIRKTEVVKKFRFPDDFTGPYYTEGIIWKKIGAQYKILIINKPLYTVHFDGSGSLLRMAKPLQLAARYVCLVATDHFNNYLRYIPDAPGLFISQAIYFWIYSFYTGETPATWRKLTPVAFMWIFLFLPIGIPANILFVIKRSFKKIKNKKEKRKFQCGKKYFM